MRKGIALSYKKETEKRNETVESLSQQKNCSRQTQPCNISVILTTGNIIYLKKYWGHVHMLIYAQICSYVIYFNRKNRKVPRQPCVRSLVHLSVSTDMRQHILLVISHSACHSTYSILVIPGASGYRPRYPQGKYDRVPLVAVADCQLANYSAQPISSP